MKDQIIKFTLLGYVILALVNTLLLPNYNFLSIDNFLFPFAFVAICLHFYRSNSFRFTFLLTCLLSGTLCLSDYLHGGLTFQEITGIMRWVKLFTIGWSTIYLYRNSPVFTESLLVIGFLLMVVVNAAQLLEIDFFIDFYAPKDELSHELRASLLDSRIYGTMLNANGNGLAFALFGIFFFFSSLRYKYILLVMSVLLLVMTQSRTAFLALALVLVTTVLFRIIQKQRRLILPFFLSAAVLAILLFQFKFRNLDSLFNGSAFGSNSFTTRLEIIQKVMVVNADSKWLGQGSVSNIPALLGGSIDNEYAFLYLQSGMLGILAVCFSLIGIGYLVLRKRKSKGLLALLVVMIISGMTNLSFSNLEIGPLFVLLFSLGVLAFDQAQHKVDQQKEGHDAECQPQTPA
jgi:hypothetical protein